MASRIQLLSHAVANKIAAGEVVERPASVLKELLENSLDAEATQIDVEVVAGGRKLLAIADNGHGMGRDDALMSVERHATSKVRDVHDIENIKTMGFRGEALAAISSVSRFTLKTCPQGELEGTEVLINGGRIQDVREAGCPAGTLIEVRNLFYNVPARKKFMRTEQTELSHVRDQFITQALAHPDVGMSLKVDGRMSYLLAGGGTLLDRLRDIFGKGYEHNLVAVDAQSEEARVVGHISLPGASRADRHEQYIFVNGRPASAPVIGHAIREGYRTLLTGDRHPLLFLNIELAPDLVDVNVHPTKKEVRFRHPRQVRDAVIDTIQNALKRGHTDEVPMPAAHEEAVFELNAPVAEPEQMTIIDLPPTRSFKYPAIPLVAPREPAEGIAVDSEESGDDGADAMASAVPADSPWAYCRVLGQIGDLYVFLETDDGYVIMDPHAAHERVLFDRFMTAFLKREVSSQALLLPETIDLLPTDARRVRDNLDLFEQMGFGVSDFGGDTFVVDALPAYFSHANASRILKDVAGTLDKSGSKGGHETWRETAIATAACRAAVKARDRLTSEELEQLVVDLAQTRMPYTCPHGRPTLIFTSTHELNRKFGRE